MISILRKKIGLGHYHDEQDFNWLEHDDTIEIEKKDNVLIFKAKGMGFSSNPPAGKCKVINFYIDPDTNKLVVEYDDTPV